MAYIRIWVPDSTPRRNAKFQNFLQLMANRLAVGKFRHNEGTDEFGNRSQDYERRLRDVLFGRSGYSKTGNLEKLPDAANYCALLFYNSLHPEQHFTPEESNGRNTLSGHRF